MTVDSRRRALDQVVITNTTNAGLWFDKYLPAQMERDKPVNSNSTTPHAKLIAEVSNVAVPPVYVHYFTRWRRALEQMGAICKEATAQGRMVIGLGAESALETAITLHRTYGVPYIPGSALKGLAAMYARNKLNEQHWGINSDAYRTLFGDTTIAGVVTFYDALLCVPITRQTPTPLHQDILTVHHKNYYDSQEDSPPADWDSPVIVSYLSATGTYLLALSGPEEWVASTYELLALALVEDGIGAKTSSGYGRMHIGGMATGSSVDVTAVVQTLQPTSAAEYSRLRQELLSQVPPARRFYATVTDVIANRSFGFAKPVAGGERVFIHFSNLRQSGAQLRAGQIVEYTLDPNRPKPSAIEVDILLEPGN